MRHGKKFNHLGRKAAHRKAMLANIKNITKVSTAFMSYQIQ